MEDKPFERLPITCVPKHYNLVLTPDLKKFTFHGEISIQFQVHKETDRIKLNSLDLSFKKILLKESSILKQTVLKSNQDVRNETVEFVFPEIIVPGNYELFIEYEGEINDKMKGLYRSKYLNRSGETAYAAVTQFAPTDARRCFPCWDEPAVKTTFDITLLISENLLALSNMPVKQTIKKNGLVRYDFETTPIMSTYLVAVVVGEFEYVEDYSSDNVLVRVYTPCGKKELGSFALEVATKALPYYKDYFKVAYPLPKMDLIAVADFSFGAMENWGLIAYREAKLLVDSKNTSALRKQNIALIVAHEIAHQWFGNLVTMEWWTHLWLNEGYASFIEFLCVDHLFPEYDIWTQFVNSMYIKALELDNLKNSHPIEVPVKHPSDLSEIFDDISYNKGASILRMLHNYIGDEDFRKGMNLYLTRYQYKNTTTEDLWGALEEASRKPIAAVMSTWTKQMGFPVIKVSRKIADNGKDVFVSLTQNKFCGDGMLPADKYLWKIPISFCTSKSPTATIKNNIIFSSQNTEILIPNVGSQDWIKINPGCIGFYRAHYPPEMLEQFVPSIKDKSLPPMDRLGLLNDLFAMVGAGYTSTVEVLKLLLAYEDETDYSVWCCIISILAKLSMLLAYTDCETAFKNFEKKLLCKISQRLGWDVRNQEGHLDTLLRGLVLSRLAWLEDEKTIQEAKKRFLCHIKNSPALPADLRSACYKIVLRAGNRTTYESLMQLYRSTDLREEKDRISEAFGAIKDEALLAEVLDFSISDEVRPQDSVFVVMSVAMTRFGRNLVWKFFKDHWAEFLDRFQGGVLLARFIKFITEHFATLQMANEIELFFKEHPSPGTERTVQQGLEAIRLNCAWIARDAGAIKSFLKDFK